MNWEDAKEENSSQLRRRWLELFNRYGLAVVGSKRERYYSAFKLFFTGFLDTDFIFYSSLLG